MLGSREVLGTGGRGLGVGVEGWGGWRVGGDLQFKAVKGTKETTERVPNDRS